MSTGRVTLCMVARCGVFSASISARRSTSCHWRVVRMKSAKDLGHQVKRPSQWCQVRALMMPGGPANVKI